MLELKSIYKEYNSKKNNKIKALNNISLKVASTGMIFICGKSGSGKSTLLNLIGSLDEPTSGEIFVNGKSLSDIRNKDLYRNNYVGFVFQDYNLIDNLNIYKNIDLALSLQGKKNNKDIISNYLEELDLKGYENRKVNELSGGQKQRVAILRSVIKESKILLCDEPTGNLDKENSIQIFETLKNISKEKLVIVVSHEYDLAKKYADRIITLNDGSIINDEEINSKDYISSDFKLNKTKLSFLNSTFLAFNNLKNKKVRLVVTMLIMTIIFTSLGISVMLTDFNVNKTHAETMIREGQSKVIIRKKIPGENLTIDNPALTFTSNDIKEVNNKLGFNTVNVSKVVENNSYLSFEFADFPFDFNIEYDNTLYSYYALDSGVVQFINYNNEIKDKEIIGKKEIIDNEVIIKKVLADYIIKNGIKVYEINDSGYRVKNDYFPKDYQELINSNKDIVFGSESLKIVGIIDEDISKYDELKTIPAAKSQKENDKLYNEFVSKYRYNISDVYVNENIYSFLKLKENNYLEGTFYDYNYIYDDNEIYTFDSISKLNKVINVYNGKKIVKINKLHDNEILLGSSMIDELTNNDFINSFTKYYDNEMKIYNNKVLEREKKLQEEYDKLLNDPNYVVIDIPEVEPLNYDKMYKNYLVKYIDENKFIGSEITLDITDKYDRSLNDKNSKFNLKIIGIILDDNTSYISDNVINGYIRENYEISNVYFNENSVDILEDIFNKFPSSDKKFISETMFSKTMDTLSSTVVYIRNIAFYISVGLIVFGFVVFINFISSSINNNKKQIGILKSMGTRTKDVFNIFYLEAFIIGFISYVISCFITYFSCNILNNIISSDLFYKAKPIIFNYDVLAYMLLFVFIIVTLSSLLIVFKITRMKPVDLIYDK